MHYKQLGILLLLQGFLFIQCLTAETADNNKIKNDSVKRGFIKTNTITRTNRDLPEKNKKTIGDNIQENNKAGEFKQLQFGFNAGYLAGLKNKDVYIKALTQLKQDGISNLRVYEPFNKEISKNPELIATILKPVVNAGFKILLCFSDFPIDSSVNNLKATSEHADELSFTNRYAPSDLNKYGAILTRVLNSLRDQNIIQNFSFEIGNEPDSKKYFWSDAASFNKIARAEKSILEKYKQPIYCCAFTTEFAVNSKSYDNNFLNLMNNGFLDDVNLSFHFYPNQKYEFSDINIPHSNNAIISEFNVYSFQKQDNQNRIQYTNSGAIGKWISELLEYTYNNNIQAVYLFNLMDNPKKNGALGFFDENGNPKPSYNYFLKFYNVIKDGYKVERNNNTVKIIGKNQTIIYSGRGANLMNKNGRPNNNEDASSWKIVNN